MKIAIDVRSLMEGRWSGVEIYTVNLIRAMLRVAPHHQYHLFYNSYRPVKLPAFGDQVHLHAWHFPNKGLNFSQALLQRPRWNTLVDGDCFFVPSLRLLPLAPRVPLVVTAHDLSYERFPEFYSWRRRRWHQLMRPRDLMRRATQVIAVSDVTATDVRQLYHIPMANVSVIHSGVTFPEAPPSAAAMQLVRQRYRLPAKFVLYLGAFEPRKNIPSLIAAFAAIADRVDCDLVLAGSPGWLEWEISAAVKASGQTARIHRVGTVAEADKPALMAAGELFIYPSFYEGFGFPPLEALLAGTPVITSSSGALPEVIGEWATMVNAYSPAELALVMQERLENPTRVTPAAQRAIRQKYSWERAARQTVAILEHAAS